MAKSPSWANMLKNQIKPAKRAKYVWRLELDHPHKIGVFQAGAARFVADNCDADPFYHPGPDTDRVLADIDLGGKDPWVFGFATLAQYKLWFTSKKSRDLLAKYRHTGLREAKVVLRKYKIDNDKKYIRSMVQVVFKRSAATLVETRIPNEVG